MMGSLRRWWSLSVSTSVLLGSGVGVGVFGQTPPPPAPAGVAKPAALSADETKARELLQQGKIEEAVEALRKAGKSNPNLPPPRVYIADLLIQAQQGQAARNSLERAAIEDPDHPQVYLLNGSIALGEGRVTDLILNCTTALKASESPRWDPEQRKRFQREARFGLAAGYESRRDYTAAREHLVALSTAEPKNAQVRSRGAVALFLMGKVEESVAEFNTAFADDPTIDPPELQVGRLWANRPDAAKAEEWYKKGMANHAKSARVFREYAGWLMNNQRIEEAKAPLDTAVALDGSGRDTAALRGLHSRYIKDFPTAETAFEKMYRESPRDRFAGLNLALVLAESPEKPKQTRAIELAESLINQNQKSPDGYAVLGWCLYKAGRFDEALKALQTAASSGSIERDTAYYLARVLVEKAQPDEARKVLTESLAAPGPFVNRKDAEAFLAEVNTKFPPKPMEPKK
ncbi:MAG: tetratricopeptide repeat protein [Gemmataceae bacterium]